MISRADFSQLNCLISGPNRPLAEPRGLWGLAAQGHEAQRIRRALFLQKSTPDHATDAVAQCPRLLQHGASQP
eukprot:5199176-Pyramimonas_sp.AAC.1